jgi:long-chain fatty acid transport protein
MRLRLLALGLLTALCCLATNVSAQNGLEPLAIGARSAGMAGVDLAIATDATAIETNPAGLMQLPGHRIDFGSGLLVPAQHFKNDFNDEDGNSAILPAPYAAYAVKLPYWPVAVGIGLFMQGGTGFTDYRLTHPLLGEDQRYYSRIATYKLAGALAYEPHPVIALGIAPSVSLSHLQWDFPLNKHPSLLWGEADVSNGLTWDEIFPVPVSQGGFGMDEVSMRFQIRDGLSYGVGLKFGVLLKPHEMVRLGLAYTLETNMKYLGHATLDASPMFAEAMRRLVAEGVRQGKSQAEAEQDAAAQFRDWGIEDEDLSIWWDSKTEFTLPQKVGLGLAVTPLESLLLAVDFQWVNYAEAMDHIRTRLRHPDNRNTKTIFRFETMRLDFPTSWNDQITAAVGVQYAFIKDLYGRLGYNYGNNPVPADRVMPIFPAFIEHHVTAGLGYRYKIFEINAAYEYGLPGSLTADSDSVFGAEFAEAEFTQGSHNAYLGASFAF